MHDRFLIMNKNDEDIDLSLALGSTNYHNQQSLKNNLGAGVNANSRVEMRFAASDPLAELVWSPNNGLSLKCADPGLGDKKPFLLWDVGQSSKCCSTSKSVRSRESEDEKVDNELNLNLSPTSLNIDGEFGDKAALLRSTRSSPSPELGANHGLCDEAKMEEEVCATDATCKDGSIKNDEDYDMCSSQNVQVTDIAQSSKENAGQDALAHETRCSQVDIVLNGQNSSKLIRRARCKKKKRSSINASSSGNMGLVVTIHSELGATNLSEAPVCSMNSLSLQEPDNEVASATEEVYKNKCRMPFPATPLKRLESFAENDLAHTAKEAQSLHEMRPLTENSLPVERPPTDSRILLYREKGKEKALSDGDMHGRSSSNEDGSRETVESCNSARLVKGIKRQNSDEELISGSKRMKKQIQGSYVSTPVFRPHSSFMNWISNMVKVLSDSTKVEPSSGTLTLAHSNDAYGKNQQENLTCYKVCDSANLSRGFKTMFQSLYCENPKMLDGGVEKENYSKEGSKELMVADRTSLENIPGTCNGVIGNSCTMVAVTNKEANPNVSGEIVGKPINPVILSAELPSTSYACESNLEENKVSKRPVCKRERGFLSPSDSFHEQLNSTSDDTNVNIPLTTSNMPEKGNPLSSLWITRLYTRSPKLEAPKEFSTQCLKDNIDHHMDGRLFIGEKCSLARDFSSEDKDYGLEKEMRGSFAADGKASVDLNSSGRLSPVESPQKLRSSEAMASVFARRLDALRPIAPSETRNSSSCMLTCFFCGRIGHNLHDCPEITKTELDDLLVKASSLDMIEESPRLCIRCFQLDHWAILCPLLSSRRHLRLEKNSSFISRSAKSQQLCAGNAKRSSYPCLSFFPSYLSWNATESSSKLHREIQKGTASNLHFPIYNPIAAHNAVASVEMFQAIRKLRLSRVDILRWMGSNVSLAHLNGFFLRLRLGKLEAGLGKSGYYVARITGDAKENVCRMSKKLILVDVGGIDSYVESPYISNHDFLEDEIDAWWHKILKVGGRIPSLNELNSKLSDRKKLGF